MSDKKTARARVEEAERLREQWYQAARAASAAASQAEGAGDGVTAREARQREANAVRLARQHEQTIAKYAAIDSMADRAGRVAALARGLKRAWDEERRVREKKEARAKRKPPTTRVAPDPILILTKIGKLNPLQMRAAKKYRDAWEACHSSLQGTLNPDRVGGGGGPRAPSPREIEGAATINLADRILGANDGRVVHLVLGEGHTIAETANRIYGRATRREQEFTGVRLREALTALGHGLKRLARQSEHGGPVSVPPRRSPPSFMDEEAEEARLAQLPSDFRRPIQPGRVAHVEPVGRRGVDVIYSGRMAKQR